MNKYYLITFENTHRAIEAEDMFKKSKLNFAVMPTPTFITRSCGISIKFYEDDLGFVKSSIANENIKIKKLYIRQGQDYQEYTC